MGNESQRESESQRECVCVCTRFSPDIPHSVMECALLCPTVFHSHQITFVIHYWLLATIALKNLSNGLYYLRLCVHHLHGDRKLTYPLVVERRESNFFSCAVFLFLGGGGDRKSPEHLLQVRYSRPPTPCSQTRCAYTG